MTFSSGKCEKPRFEVANRTLRRPYRGKYPYVHPDRGNDPCRSGSSPLFAFSGKLVNPGFPYLHHGTSGHMPLFYKMGTPIGVFIPRFVLNYTIDPAVHLQNKKVAR
jgi:hypothetical protein